jgi:hypothetical protein
MSLVKLFPILAAGAPVAGGAFQFLFGWVLPVLIPVLALAGVIYYVNSLPLRRQEGARFVLDLIESALQQGQSIEQHIISLARSRDVSPGVRFHLLAANLEKGYSLIPALEKVPELLPPQVLAMLKVGQTLGDFRRVLPACRHLLRDGTSQARALINYQVAFGLVLNPLLLILLPFLAMSVLPVFTDISTAAGMPRSFYNDTLLRWFPLIMVVQVAFVLACFLGAIFLLGGTRFVSWLEAGVLPLRDWADWLFLHVPWRRKRLQRDFSAMLGLLLDAGVPEERVLDLAASSTANRVFIRRAEEAVESLRLGAKFPEAVQMLDETGEFKWRLANGTHGTRGFFFALEGWQASLDAKAFQLEQGAAHVISTSLVLINALTVALVATGVYQFINHLSTFPFSGRYK